MHSSAMDKPLVSIILASIRPHQLARCLASIERYTGDVDYEVVVISPFDIERHPNVTHVKEAKPKGYYVAVASGYERAKGEYIIHIADDCRATPFWAANMIAFIQPHDDEIFEGSFRHFDVRGERPEQGHYGKLIVPFICIRRDKAERIGGLMDCYYRSFWGDPDLSLRVWHNDGRVETCPNAWVYHHDCDDELYESRYNSYFMRDQEAFIRRWYHIYARPGDSFLGHQQPLNKQTLSSELPPEECTKLYVSLQRRDWKTVKNILMSNNSDACIYPEGFPILHNCVVKMLRSPLNCRKTLYPVLEWLCEKGYAPPASTLRLEQNMPLRERVWRVLIEVALGVVTATRMGKLISKIVPYFVKRRLLNRS